MRYPAAFLAVVVLLAAAIHAVYGYVVNSDVVGTVLGATTDGSLIYAYGYDSQGAAIFVFDGFRLSYVYHFADADQVNDAQYYNGYLYAVGRNGLIVMINVGNWQESRRVQVGYTPTAIEKIGDQFYVAGYLYNETTGRYDTYMSIFDLNLNLADEKVLQIYEYGGMIPLDISWNGTHVAIVGYTVDSYTGSVYPVTAYWDPASGSYTYTIYTDTIGYGTSVDVCGSFFVFALGPRILFNNTFYDIGYNVTDVACLNNLIWFAYNEDGLVNGNATTVVHVGYINLTDNSITDVVAGYGRVYAYGDPVIYGNSVLFGGSAYCPECGGSYPSVAALFLMDPVDYVVEVRTATVTETVTTTTTKTVAETQPVYITETESTTVYETTTVRGPYTEFDLAIVGVVAFVLALAICCCLLRR